MATISSDVVKSTIAADDSTSVASKRNPWDPGPILHPSKIDPATLARAQAIWACMHGFNDVESSDDDVGDKSAAEPASKGGKRSKPQAQGGSGVAGGGEPSC